MDLHGETAKRVILGKLGWTGILSSVVEGQFCPAVLARPCPVSTSRSSNRTVRISRIRLSDQTRALRPQRETTDRATQS